MISLRDIWRHPVKSHGRERLEQVTLEAHKTMPWDRRYAVAHTGAKITEDLDQWASFMNFSRGAKAPALMAINIVADVATNTVHMTHPDLDDLSVNLETPEGKAALIKWVAPLMPTERMESSFVVRVPDRGMTDTDFPSVSINTYASLDALSARMGTDVSPLRWRGNLWLDGGEAWMERDWIGREIMLGEVRMLVREPVIRCLATTANPETGERDLDTLTQLREGWNHQEMGVYAEVLTGGTLRLGDTLSVL